MFVPSAVSLSVNLSFTITGNAISLKFPSVSGHNYTVQWNTSINGGTWQTLSGGSALAGAGTTKTVPVTLVPGSTRFYRLLIQ